jgi:hypothetical protein
MTRTAAGVVRTVVFVVGVLAAAPRLSAQQVPDTLFAPRVSAAAYAAGTGPRVLIDGGHHNFHTVSGRYRPFAQLAARDGYRVSGSTDSLTDASLARVDILVIANALAARNDNGHWELPTPSAFTAGEIAAVRRWVERGGALLLIADHMPFGGAIEAMGDAMGVTWYNGFAYDSANNSLYRYTRVAGMSPHPIFNGRSAAERVDSLVAFTGSALRLHAPGAVLLTVPAGSRVRMPRVAWQFSDSSASVGATGLLQGATLRIGKGRVVAVGEAAMFSAQRAGPQGANPMGFNDPTAPQNAQFALNVLHWLSGLLPEPKR